jgi:hypothetical protein
MHYGDQLQNSPETDGAKLVRGWHFFLISTVSALGSTQSLTETSPRNLPGSKGRPACKADNLTAIDEPIV